MKNFKKISMFLMLSLSLNSFSDETTDFKYVDNLYKNKNFKEALLASENFLKKYPNSSHRLSMKDKIGKLYFLNKNYDKTIDIFKELYINEKNRELKDGYSYYLIRSYAAKGDIESLNFYLQKIDNKKIYEVAMYEAGIEFLKKDYHSEAIQLFSKVINLKSNNYDDALLNLGVAYYNSKNYENAYKIFKEYISRNPKKNRNIANYLIGSSLYKSDKTEEAIPYFNNTLSEKNYGVYSKKSILTLIEIYANKKDEDKVTYYLKKIEGTKEYNTAMIMLGDLYVSKKKYQEAIEIYHKSNDLNNPRLIYGEAYSLYKLEKYDEALKKFEILKDTNYYNQAIYHIFAIHYKLQNYQKILDNRDVMKRVVVTQTDTDNINTIIANSAYRLGNYKLAKDYYGRLFAISTKKENLFRVILLDSQILDMEDLSIRFQQYKKNFPNDEEYRKDIYLYTGDAYFKSGKYEEAELIYKEYLNKYSNFEVLSSLVSTLLEQKKYDEMEFYLSQVKDINKINYLKGISSVGLGKYQEAENFFEQVLNSPDTDEILKYKVYVNRVRNFFLWQKYENAIQVGERALSILSIEKDKNLIIEILDKIGISNFRLGRYDVAQQYYSKISNIEGYEVYGNFQIADSYYNQKDYDKAASLYKNLYTNFQETFYGEQAYYKYIIILSLKNNRELFEKEKNNFLSLYPESSFRNSLMHLSANFYSSNNDTSKAIESLNEITSSTDDEVVKNNNTLKIIDLKLKNKDYQDIEKYISELTDEEERLYLSSKYNSAIKNYKLALSDYEKLLKYKKYKDYASLKLADYWYEKKDDVKAKKYYEIYKKESGKNAEEYATYRFALINDKLGQLNVALSAYKEIYQKNQSPYKLDSMLKAAEIFDKKENITEAKKLFFILYKEKDNKNLHEYTLEKLIYYRLVENNKKEAKRYLNELKALNPKRAEKYNSYF